MISENLSEEEHGTTSGKGGHIALNMRLLTFPFFFKLHDALAKARRA